MKIPATALLVLLALLARAQQPAIQNLASYSLADQDRYRAGAPAPAAGPGRVAVGSRVLRPGVVVFGWLPAWMPLAYARQVDYDLLSHVACTGYRATEQGGLLPPPGEPAGPLAALAHQANPRCRVLLGLEYQEPATGAALFGAAGQPARQALVQALAQQAGALKLDGVHLALRFQPRAAAVAHPAGKQELKQVDKRLDKRLSQLNHTTDSLNKAGNGLRNTKKKLDAKAPAGQPRPASLQAQYDQYDRLLSSYRQDSTRHHQQVLTYRQERAAQQNKQVLTGAGPDDRPALVREFVAALGQALRQQHPGATLTLSLPAVDSARVYGTGLAALAPLVQAGVVEAFDYTPGRRGPLAPLQPSAQWGPNAVATSVSYYLHQGLPPTQLVVGLAPLGKVWALYANSLAPASGAAPPPYRYLTGRTLRSWPPNPDAPAAKPAVDPVAGSLLLRLGPDPAPANPAAAPADAPVAAPHAAWADDSASLAARYEWVRGQGLGIGIWALGFDAPDAPLWGYVRARLAGPDSLLTAAPAAGPAPLPLAADTARAASPAPQAARADSTATGSTGSVGDTLTETTDLLLKRPLAHVLLFSVVVLLACAWLGLLAGAVAYARYWVPFPRRLTRVLALALGGAVLLAAYVSCLGYFSRGALLAGWLTALCLLAGLLLAYRLARPAHPLP